MEILNKFLNKNKETAGNNSLTPPLENAEDQNSTQAVNPGNSPGTDNEILATILEKLKAISDDVNSRIEQFDKRLADVEKKVNENTETQKLKEELDQMHKTLDEFTAVYETISNQYNPFVSDDTKSQEHVKEIDLQDRIGSAGVSGDAAASGNIGGRNNSHLMVEDAITKNVEKVEMGSQNSEIHLNESFNIKGSRSPRDVKSHVDININDPKDLDKAISNMTNINDDMKKEIIDSIIFEKKKKGSKKLMKNVSKKRQFKTKGHKPVCCLIDLVNLLNNYPKVFKEHVGPRKDHFAKWVGESLKMKRLAKKLSTIKNRDKYLIAILSEA